METNNTELTKVIEAVAAALDKAAVNGAVKPVQLAQIVGVREQFVYNYIDAGRITGFKNAGGYHRVKVDVAKAWAAGYLTRKYNKDS